VDGFSTQGEANFTAFLRKTLRSLKLYLNKNNRRPPFTFGSSAIFTEPSKSRGIDRSERMSKYSSKIAAGLAIVNLLTLFTRPPFWRSHAAQSNLSLTTAIP